MKTRMKTIWTLGGVAALLTCIACENKPAEPKPEETAAQNDTTGAATTVAPTAAPTAATPVAISDTDLSTPADFEEAVEKQITTKNYKAELTSLEKELEKDGT